MRLAPIQPLRRPAAPFRKRFPRLLHPGGPDVERTLLELHSVQEMRQFWNTTRRVSHQALPLDFICLCLRPFVQMPSTIFRERAPFASEAEFQLFQELSPLQSYLAARPGTRVVRMSDILSDSELLGTEFYRRFMLPQEDRYFACLNFWHHDVFQGMIGLHRTLAQRDFTDAEIGFIEELHPYFDTVLQRILVLHRERAVRLSLEKLLGSLPIATVLLDWDLSVAYRNRLAVELSAVWHLGRKRARIEKCGENFALPAPVLAYCEDFKARWNPCHHRFCDLAAPAGVTFTHSEMPELSASVNLLQLNAAPLSMPLFLIRLEDKSGADANGEAADRPLPLAQLARLSPREREVAMLIGRGCSNEEVARLLHKSVLTVKKQLRSIYEKLPVSGRGRLIALMR